MDVPSSKSRSRGDYGVALEVSREIAYRQLEGVLHSLGALARAEEDLDETEAHFRQARELLAPGLTYLAENPTLDGAEHPYQAFLICGQILLAVGLVIQAREIVGAAHDRLVAW